MKQRRTSVGSIGRAVQLLAIVLLLSNAGSVQATARVSPANHAPQGTSPEAPNAVAWYDGLIQYSTITNCFSIIQGMPYQENGAGTYVGFIADPNAGQPAPNQSYYVHVVVAGLGNACSGQRAYIDLALPANSSLAINGTDKVRCYYDGTPLSAAECPQTLPASSYNPGAYYIPSSDTAHANLWPIPQGHILEIQVPIKSSTALTNSPLGANVWMFDGNSSPWLRPQQGVYVFSSTPTIIYPSPSTITVTATTAHSQAYLYTFGATGTGYFDLGTTTSYGLVHESVAITSGTAWLVWDDWGPPPLQPDTLYHWRFTFTTASSQTYLGPDQTFRTLPDGRVTIGQGQSADCTSTAFTTALATAKEILFNCGALPITITLSSGQSIASDVTINGGNKVTLDAGSTRHFTIQAGTHLTLTQITLINGSTAFVCGGAIYVPATASLTLNETRLINNHSGVQGGALCNSGSVNITATLFMNNSTSSHGGAIGNYGVLNIANSLFMKNHSDVNGGGIDTTVALTVTHSTFVSNTAGFRGGGINNYTGALNIAGSSFISNTASLYGGGLSNDAPTGSVSSSTFWDNYAANYGGAIETSGALALSNSTVHANRAAIYGGGLYWGGAGGFALLNDTIASNTAITQGGNIYVGGSYNAAISLKNTLVAAGSPNNCDSHVLSQGYNLESANSCGLVAGGDQVSINPNLGPLQNNGGGTLTRALQPGSPAIDKGTNSGCPATDQRSVLRPIDGNHDGVAVCDIGAYEAPTTWQIFLPLALKNH